MKSKYTAADFYVQNKHNTFHLGEGEGEAKL